MTFYETKKKKKCVLRFKMHVFPSSKIPDHPMGTFVKSIESPIMAFVAFQMGECMLNEAGFFNSFPSLKRPGLQSKQ